MQPVQPIVKDLVLVGGGHTHAIALRKWGMQPLAGVRLTLITNLIDTPYSGMLPCHISGLYDFDESHIDLRPLTRFAQCRLLMDRAIGLDLAQQQVICAHHPPVAYDLLSLDTGSTPATLTVPGAAEHAIPAKPVPQLLRAWTALLESIKAHPERPVSLAVVGGGVGGVELTLNMEVRLRQLMAALGQPPENLTIHLFHRGPEVATGRNRSTRRRLHQHFVARGVQLHLQESVCALEPVTNSAQRRVRCESGLTVTCDRVFWVTHASAPPWLRDAGLATDDRGFVQVRDTLQTCSHDNVFAVGDVATMVNHPRPKAGVFAVRQGPPLFHNLQALLLGRPLQAFTPQRQYLNIIDTGDGSAIASRGPFTFESSLMRAWKDRIDRQFMGLFKDFPAMTADRPGASAQVLPTDTDAQRPQMYCAGCGSKVGSRALNAALQRVRADFPAPGDRSQTLLIGLEAPDDAAVVQVPEGQLMVHSVDFFRAMLDDPFILAQVCLKHCLSDLYAMGAEPQSVLALATLPYASENKQAELLYQLLAGIYKGLLPSQTPLVGGHTTEGPELSLGFACNGLVSPQQLLRKSGLRPGDRLILTQPLGTGTLFAADMQKAARGRWIENAVTHMLRSNDAAAHCLRRHGATACTDVTGFGLLGHLLEMVEASQVTVSLNVSALPILFGAQETLRQGIVSSLHAPNQQAARSLRNAADYAEHPDYPLLFDPQTAGGLLAGVPCDRADTCLRILHNLGYTASTLIGEVLPPQDKEPPITLAQGSGAAH